MSGAIISHPDQIEWNEGDLPPVDSVPYNCTVLAWFVHNITQDEYDRCNSMMPGFRPAPSDNGNLARIVGCHPNENELNPLRWCDMSGHPVGYQEKVAFWAWVYRGDGDAAFWARVYRGDDNA